MEPHLDPPGPTWTLTWTHLPPPGTSPGPTWAHLEPPLNPHLEPPWAHLDLLPSPPGALHPLAPLCLCGATLPPLGLPPPKPRPEPSLGAPSPPFSLRAPVPSFLCLRQPLARARTHHPARPQGTPLYLVPDLLVPWVSSHWDASIGRAGPCLAAPRGAPVQELQVSCLGSVCPPFTAASLLWT